MRIPSGLFFGDSDISMFGLIFALSYTIGVLTTMLLAKKDGQSPENYLILGSWLVFISLFGGRIGYVFLHWQIYRQGREEVLRLPRGGILFIGGLLFCVIFTWLYTRKKKMGFWKILDTVAPGLALSQMLGRFAYVFDDIYIGKEYSGFMCLEIKELDPTDVLSAKITSVYPVYGIEMIVMLALAIGLYFVFKKNASGTGRTFSIYLISFGLMRFATEYLKADGVDLFGGLFRMAHSSAVVIIAIGLFVHVRSFMIENRK